MEWSLVLTILTFFFRKIIIYIYNKLGIISSSFANYGIKIAILYCAI